MDPSDETNQLIDRLLKSNVNPSNLNPNDAQASDPLNLTDEQLQLLANYYTNQTGQQAVNTKDKNFKSFIPEPGICLKTKTSKNEKVFINICKSNEIIAPKDITEDELLKLIEQNDAESAAFHYRVPMSLAEPHSELDNSGDACAAYDVCISPDFLKKISENATFMGFFMSIVIEGIEEKYNIKLDRNCKMLKNKKFMGKINEHFIRIKSKPLISEMNNQNNDKKSTQTPEIKHETPKYRIFREPADGPVEFLVAEIELPKIISAKSLLLDIGEDRILLSTRSGLYHLDIYLPFKMNQEECGAQFDKKTKLLTVTIPVVV